MQPCAGIRTAVSFPRKWNNIILHSVQNLEGGINNARLCKMCPRTGLATRYRLITRQM